MAFAVCAALASDRRRTSIEVTEAVRRYVRELEEGPSGRLVRALESATPAQRAAIGKGLRLLRGLLGSDSNPLTVVNPPMANRTLFFVAQIPALIVAGLHLWVFKTLEGTTDSSRVPELTQLGRVTFHVYSVFQANLPLIFIGAGVGVIVLATVNRARALRAGSARASAGSLPWIAFAGACWLVPTVAGWLIQTEVPGLTLVLMWAAVVSSALAIGEGYSAQVERQRIGRSSWSPLLVVVVGLAIFFVEPLLMPLAALVPELLLRSDVARSEHSSAQR